MLLNEFDPPNYLLVRLLYKHVFKYKKWATKKVIKYACNNRRAWKLIAYCVKYRQLEFQIKQDTKIFSILVKNRKGEIWEESALLQAPHRSRAICIAILKVSGCKEI